MDRLTGFEIGGHYENRKGPYEVIAMDGDRMTIHWGSGEEIAVIGVARSLVSGLNIQHIDCSIQSRSQLALLLDSQVKPFQHDAHRRVVHPSRLFMV